MIKNGWREVLSLDSSTGCYLVLSQVYLEVACDVVPLSKKVNGWSMHLCMPYDELLCLWYSCYVYAIISYDHGLLTNPLRYLMFGMIVSILGTYRTNTFCLNIVLVGS